MSPFATLVAVAVLAAFSPLSGAYSNQYRNCVAKTDAIYTFPATNLSSVNPFLFNDPNYQALLAAGCPTDRDAGVVCPDSPAIGTGLTQLFPKYFLGLTEGGPTQDCATLAEIDPVKYAGATGKSGTAYVIPKSAPAIVHFQTKDDDSSLIVRRGVPLKGKDGKPITALPNSAADTVPYGPGCAGESLAYDPSGIRPTDLGFMRNTDYVVLTEANSPSVVVINYKTGMIAARHVPKKLGPSLSSATYDIVADIPDVYAYRKAGYGFGGIVVDPFGRFVIAVMASSMMGEDTAATMDNQIIRCAYFSVSKTNGVPTLTYTKSFVIEASSPSAYRNKAIKAMDIMYVAAQFRTKFELHTMERVKGQSKLFKIDHRFATNIDDTKYADNLDLETATNGNFLAQQFGVLPAKKTLVWDSAKDVPGGTIDFNSQLDITGFAVDQFVTGKLWLTNDNSFGGENNGASRMTQVALGRAAEGATVCEMPEHPPAPKINMVPTRKLRLKAPRTFRISNEIDARAAESLDVNEVTKLAYVVNTKDASVDMYNISTSVPRPLIKYKAQFPYEPTSVAVCEMRGLIAAALTNFDEPTKPGRLVVFDKDLNVLRLIMRLECVQPADVKWTEDCKFLVSACEGEGKDVEGGALVADYGGPAGKWYRGVKFASFKQFDSIAQFFEVNGVRLIESDKPSNDLEPKYITTVGHHAFVTVQENNAVAVIDLAEAAITELKPLGFIDRSKPGFALDTSDKDGRINIRNYRFLYGMPQPDHIQSYAAADGKTYLIYANEGAAKESEEYCGKDLTDENELNRAALMRLEFLSKDDNLLGRLKFSSTMGFNETTGRQEALYHFGGRSFSIMAMNGTVVFDSGNWLARIQRRYYEAIFNADGFDGEDLSKSMEDLFDSRSAEKGVEPESLAVMTTADGKTYAFVGFERPSTIVVFDVTMPTAPTFVFSINNNPTNMPIETVFKTGKQGDMDPEGLFASLKLKKLVVSGAVSNTVTTYDIVMV